MPVEFKPKAAKPHIKIYTGKPASFLWVYRGDDFAKTPASSSEVSAMNYCSRVNRGNFRTPGEAARALHYGSKV
jgi:hypothetical protein